MTFSFCLLIIFVYISTHILTRRMTVSLWNRHTLSVFQLTSSQGGWPIASLNSVSLSVFQLTSSQGGWQGFIFILMESEYFNSHPHKEDDLTSHTDRNQLIIFQLTSSQGGWLAPTKVNFGELAISTHILTRRMTSGRRRTSVLKLFQLTSSQGGWQSWF